MKLLICLTLLLVTATVVAKTQAVYPFDDPQQSVQFNHLLNQLRCLVCQNQSLAESDAPLASDLRQQIYLMVKTGQSDAVIKQYLIKRYGDFILFNPPLKPNTYILWFAPFILLLLSWLVFAMFVKRRRVKLS